MSKLRDRIVWLWCNWLIQNVASPEYRAFITAIIGTGRARLEDAVKIEYIRGNDE